LPHFIRESWIRRRMSTSRHLYDSRLPLPDVHSLCAALAAEGRCAGANLQIL
jgi:hypothetical protein